MVLCDDCLVISVLKGCGMQKSWPDLMYNVSICLQGVRKTMQVFSNNSRHKSQDFNNFAVKFRDICTV